MLLFSRICRIAALISALPLWLGSVISLFSLMGGDAYGAGVGFGMFVFTPAIIVVPFQALLTGVVRSLVLKMSEGDEEAAANYQALRKTLYSTMVLLLVMGIVISIGRFLFPAT